MIDDVRALGHAATRTQLRTLGWTHRAIRQAVHDEELVALTRSWVGTPDIPDYISTALRLHGLVGGSMALRTHGVWVAESPHPVIAFSRNRALPAMASGIAHVRGDGIVDPHYPWRVSVFEALRQYIPTTTKLWAIAAVDSALHKGLLTQSELVALGATLNREQRRWLRRVDRRAESGLETILRLACLEQGWHVDIQVRVPGGRVDLVINGWLYIEIDGSEFHDLADQARKDRDRNTAIVRMGYRWHRFSYKDIRFNLYRSIETIRMILRQGPPPVTVTNR